MTNTQLLAINHIKALAENARRELGYNAANGRAARPTVKQLNSTLDRLASIINTIDNAVLA
jgi:hypothetical protein